MKKYAISVLLVIYLFSFNAVAFANSAPVYWAGDKNAESLVLKQNSPIEVLQEDLLFDFQQWDDGNGEGQVTASYKMRNPTDQSQIVSMGFPFTGRFRYMINDLNEIAVSAGGKAIPTKIYLGEKIKESEDLQVEDIMATIFKKWT